MNNNINYNKIDDRKTVIVNMNLADGSTKKVDFKNNHCLSFQPDAVRPRYITYTSLNNNPSNINPMIKVDFLYENRYLAPYNSRTSIMTFSELEFKTLSHVNYANVTFSSVGISSDASEVAYDSGTLIICLEFIKYGRK